MGPSQSLEITDVAGSLYDAQCLLQKLIDMATGRLGDYSLAEKAGRAKRAVKFVNDYFSRQDGLDADLDEINKQAPGLCDNSPGFGRYNKLFLEKISKFFLDSEFTGELANVISSRKKAEDAAGIYMKGYKAIFFDALAIAGCEPEAVLPRLAFLRVNQNLEEIVNAMPDNTAELKEISLQLSIHAIAFGNAIMPAVKTA
ncbi:MAG: hypothetical protein HYT16_00870 [DPANN group archaeon]|nr:hypothetical protein [DPANN group archaeon]